MKTKITNSPIVKAITVILTALVIIYAAWTVSNTFQAYEIISENYDTFNYPNTIKVHSCNIDFHYNKELDIKCTITTRISAENAYGQRSYETFTGSSSFSGPNHHLTSLGWYEENMEYMYDFYYDESKENNVFIPLLNFLIWKDWV